MNHSPHLHRLITMAAQTLRDVLIRCGVPADGIFFNGDDKPDRIASELFDDDFDSCLLLTFQDIENECQTMSDLTVAQGQIRLTPSTKRNMKAFIEWAKSKLIIGENPEDEIFPVADAMEYIRRHKSHKIYMDKSKILSEAAKPGKLTDDTKWIDWFPTFVNYLRAIPGVNGVPLSYVIRDDEAAALTDDPTLDFLDNYIQRCHLNGQYFAIDNLEIHTYIIHFISGNSVAEAKITAHGQVNSGRADFLALRDHFEGVGINAHEITRAQRVLTSLYCAGEKNPHMWWAEFEKELSRAFAIFDRVEGRQVHSDDMKLRILLPKISADFLKQTSAALNVELSKVPMTLTYATAISTCRNTVAQKFPPDVGTVNNRSRRVVSELSSGRGRGGRGGRYGRGSGGRFRGDHPYNGRGRGRGRNGGRGNNNGRTKSRPDSWWAVGESGKVVECHPLISYPNVIWYDIPQEDRNKILELRRQNGNSRRNNSSGSIVSEITQGNTYINGQQYTLVPTSQISQVGTQASPLPPPPPPIPPLPPPAQVTFMGGRNEQASLRSRNNNNTWNS